MLIVRLLHECTYTNDIITGWAVLVVLTRDNGRLRGPVKLFRFVEMSRLLRRRRSIDRYGIQLGMTDGRSNAPST